MSIETKNWFTVRNWLARGFKIRSVQHNRDRDDKTVYTICKPHRALRKPQPFAALFGKGEHREGRFRFDA